MRMAWKAPLGLLATLVIWGSVAFGQADAASRIVLYLPLDDRPYSLDRVLEVAEALDARLLLPPYSFFRGRDGIPDFGGLYDWLAAHRQEGPAVIAADPPKPVQVVELPKRETLLQIHEMKREIFDRKALGNIYLVQAEWYWKYPPNGINNDELPGKLDWPRFCGPAGEQKFEPMKFRSWRFFWPFSGGNVTDQGTHLMDVVQWMMGVNQPVSALQYGNVYVNKPTETPDVFCCTFEYPNFMATWTLNYSTAKWRNGWSILFHGEKAALFLTEQGYRVFDQVNGWENGLPKPVREDMPGGVTDTTPHMKNFLECVKSRKDPNATVEIGHQAVRTLHLANIALKKQTRAILDADGITVRT